MRQHGSWLIANCSVNLVVQDHVSHFSHIRSIWEFAGDHPLDGFAQIHLETPEIQILEEGIHQPDLLVIRRRQERPRVGVIQSHAIKCPGWLA